MGLQSSLHSPHLSASEFSSVQRHFYWHDNPKLTIQPQGLRHNLPLFSSLTSLLKISSASLPPPPIMSSPFMCLSFFAISRLFSHLSPFLPPALPLLLSIHTNRSCTLGPQSGGVSVVAGTLLLLFIKSTMPGPPCV